jgi:hypothetical protein
MRLHRDLVAVLAPLSLLLLLLTACGHESYNPHQVPWIQHVSMFGFVIAMGDIWACFHVWTGSRSLLSKLIWTFIIWVFPFGGLFLFWMFGDRTEFKQPPPSE